MSVGMPLDGEIDSLCKSLGIIGRPYTIEMERKRGRVVPSVTVRKPDIYFDTDGRPISSEAEGRIVPTAAGGFHSWFHVDSHQADDNWESLQRWLGRWARRVRAIPGDAAPSKGGAQHAETGSGNSEPCWHDAGEEPPSGFHGPLTGTKKKLLQWVRPNSKDTRALDTLAKNKAYWLRKDATREFSIWFESEGTFLQANRKRVAENDKGA